MVGAAIAVPGPTGVIIRADPQPMISMQLASGCGDEPPSASVPFRSAAGSTAPWLWSECARS